ncbi:MAG: hypothetical protein BroJett026_11110 [Betaproteobacteria bacterium]|nr:MAG: hypothetical protein BroJett026_11110 [Betaproteobacteria bacterium]
MKRSSVDAPARARRLAAVLVASALAASGGAHASGIYKCVDRKGHTTYQQSPCPDGQGGPPLELAEPLVSRPGALPSDKAEALWHAAAREGRAVVGMPKPFVTQGMGSPAGIRPPRSGEIGSEVWVYTKGGQVTRIGFQDNAVAWMRTDAPERKPAGAALASAATADRETRVREGLAIGKTCTAALQDAGPPDREEPLAVGQGAGTGTRYIYVFDAANANAYAAFVCLNGRVTSVERYLPGQK